MQSILKAESSLYGLAVKRNQTSLSDQTWVTEWGVLVDWVLVPVLQEEVEEEAAEVMTKVKPKLEDG